MPATDPTFQHSDEDWTQITQPRLRKRVQNRVSQRKHRNKLRQQRTNSIDAGQTISAPVNAPGYWPSNGSLPLNASSGLADRGHPTQTGVSSKQQQLETTLYPERNGFESYGYSNFQAPDFGTARLPWVGNLPPANPEASSYPHTPSLLPGDSSQVPTMWGSPSALNSKRPSVPSSATSSAYGFGHNDVHTSQYDASQQWSSYSTPTDSLGSPPIDYSQHPSYTSWEPQRGSEYLSSYAVGAPPHYASNLASSVDGRSGGTVTAVPTSGPKTSLVDASDRLSTPPSDCVVPRGSGINPAYYKHGKHHRDPSRPKHPKTSRY